MEWLIGAGKRRKKKATERKGNYCIRRALLDLTKESPSPSSQPNAYPRWACRQNIKEEVQTHSNVPVVFNKHTSES